MKQKKLDEIRKILQNYKPNANGEGGGSQDITLKTAIPLHTIFENVFEIETFLLQNGVKQTDKLWNKITKNKDAQRKGAENRARRNRDYKPYSEMNYQERQAVLKARKETQEKVEEQTLADRVRANPPKSYDTVVLVRVGKDQFVTDKQWADQTLEVYTLEDYLAKKSFHFGQVFKVSFNLLHYISFALKTQGIANAFDEARVGYKDSRFGFMDVDEKKNPSFILNISQIFEDKLKIYNPNKTKHAFSFHYPFVIDENSKLMPKTTAHSSLTDSGVDFFYGEKFTQNFKKGKQFIDAKEIMVISGEQLVEFDRLTLKKKEEYEVATKNYSERTNYHHIFECKRESEWSFFNRFRDGVLKPKRFSDTSFEDLFENTVKKDKTPQDFFLIAGPTRTGKTKQRIEYVMGKLGQPIISCVRNIDSVQENTVKLTKILVDAGKKPHKYLRRVKAKSGISTTDNEISIDIETFAKLLNKNNGKLHFNVELTHSMLTKYWDDINQVIRFKEVIEQNRAELFIDEAHYECETVHYDHNGTEFRSTLIQEAFNMKVRGRLVLLTACPTMNNFKDQRLVFENATVCIDNLIKHDRLDVNFIKYKNAGSFLANDMKDEIRIMLVNNKARIVNWGLIDENIGKVFRDNEDSASFVSQLNNIAEALGASFGKMATSAVVAGYEIQKRVRDSLPRKIKFGILSKGLSIPECNDILQLLGRFPAEEGFEIELSIILEGRNSFTPNLVIFEKILKATFNKIVIDKTIHLGKDVEIFSQEEEIKGILKDNFTLEEEEHNIYFDIEQTNCWDTTSWEEVEKAVKHFEKADEYLSKIYSEYREKKNEFQIGACGSNDFDVVSKRLNNDVNEFVHQLRLSARPYWRKDDLLGEVKGKIFEKTNDILKMWVRIFNFAGKEIEIPKEFENHQTFLKELFKSCKEIRRGSFMEKLYLEGLSMKTMDVRLEQKESYENIVNWDSHVVKNFIHENFCETKECLQSINDDFMLTGKRKNVSREIVWSVSRKKVKKMQIKRTYLVPVKTRKKSVGKAVGKAVSENTLRLRELKKYYNDLKSNNPGMSEKDLKALVQKEADRIVYTKKLPSRLKDW